MKKRQGKVAASTLTSTLSTQHLPKVIINVGISGRIHGDIRIGGVIYVTDISDPTGNTAAEPHKDPDRYDEKHGVEDIQTDEEINIALSAFRRDHSDEFKKWEESCANELKAINCESDGMVQMDGFLASGDSVGKSEAFKKHVKDHNRNTLGYEMEAYAIAQTAKFIIKARLVFIKGVSDNTDHKKGQDEASTKGQLRHVAGMNAFGLAKILLRPEVIGKILKQSADVPIFDGQRLPTVQNTSSAGRRRFPYFQESEIIGAAQLATLLLKSTDTKLTHLRQMVCSKTPRAVADLKNGTRKTVSRYLNEILDLDIRAQAAYWIPKYTRSHKVWSDAARQHEHEPEVVNRVLLEEVLLAAKGLPEERRTPIITCLVEDTDHHHAMEGFKRKFQEANRVIIDFDARPLEELYRISDDELIIDKTAKYDVIFHYHLSINKLFDHGVLPELEEIEPDSSRREALLKQLIPNVRDECCYALKRDGDSKLVALPVNANSMVLLFNKRLFSRYKLQFRDYSEGKASLDPPRTWDDFDLILKFFKKEGEHGIVLQQKKTSDSLYFEWCNFAHSIGKGVINKPKRRGWLDWKPEMISIASEETIRATEFYASLSAFHPPDISASECDAKRQLERFAEGDVAMAIVWSDVLYKFFAKKNRIDDFGVSVIPGNKSIVGGGLVCINKQSKNKAIAMELLRQLLDRKNQTTLMESGWCSGFERVYESSRLNKLGYAKAVAASLKQACFMIEAGPRAHKVREIVGNRLEEALQGNHPIKHVMKAAEAELREEFFS